MSSDNKDKAWWVVVADEASAVIYRRETRRSPLQVHLALSNEAARKKLGDLMSDRGGRSFDSRGEGRHTMSNEKTDPKTQSAQVFARDIAGRIASAIHAGRCRGYALVAAPRFLGLLRDAVSRSCSSEPYATVDKEMIGQEPAAIERLLA